MPSTPYLSPKEFKISTGGLDVSDIDDIELEDILLRSSQQIDEYTGQRWDYQVIQDESSDWLGLRGRYPLKKGPPRIITAFRVITGTALGTTLAPSATQITTSPVGPSWITTGPGQLPYLFGYIKLDRDNEFIEISQTNFNMGFIGMPYFGGLARAETLISYTAGYNPAENPDGTPFIAPDGYSWPYPVWLQAATREIAIEELSKRDLYEQGMGSYEMIRQGDTEVRRPSERRSGSQSRSVEITESAKKYLPRKRRTALI
jgi:hypothetical protein